MEKESLHSTYTTTMNYWEIITAYYTFWLICVVYDKLQLAQINEFSNTKGSSCFAYLIIQMHITKDPPQKLVYEENKMDRHYDFDKCTISMQSYILNRTVGDVGKTV